MKLRDRILSRLPDMMASFPEGVPIAQVAGLVGADAPSARAALDELEKDGSLKIARRGVALFVVPADWHRRVCLECRIEFDRPKKVKTKTCSRKCGVAMSWKSPGARARRVAGIKAERQTPEARARATKINNERWAKPGEREKLAQRNREMWADPEQNIKQAVAITRAHRKPDYRKAVSERIKARWDDPEGRAKLEAGIRKSKRSPQARAKFSNLLKERWADPELREKYLAATRENAKKGLAVAHENRRLRGEARKAARGDQ